MPTTQSALFLWVLAKTTSCNSLPPSPSGNKPPSKDSLWAPTPRSSCNLTRLLTREHAVLPISRPSGARLPPSLAVPLLARLPRGKQHNLRNSRRRPSLESRAPNRRTNREPGNGRAAQDIFPQKHPRTNRLHVPALDNNALSARAVLELAAGDNAGNAREPARERIDSGSLTRLLPRRFLFLAWCIL